MQKKPIKTKAVTLDAIEKLLDKKLEEKLDEKLEEKLTQQTIEFREEIQLSEERTDKKAKAYKDQLSNKLDHVMGELETIREEQILSAGQYRDHEKRITDLEKLQRINQ